jgi:hypothetical protein
MLQISANRRFIVHDNGTPFFYLGDTAWELFHRCTLSEAVEYLHDRAAKGFTVIQAVVLAELDGLHVPNAQGDLPLIGDDPRRPNEAYFAHVDAIVEAAVSLGLYVGMLPTWGDKWNRKWGVGPEIFTPENARAYGTFLGQRYADHPIIWILGGDRPIETDAHRAVVRAMAEGLREGDDGNHLIAFHTWGPHSSTEYVQEEPWLDLHMCQSGHKRNMENWRLIEADYRLTPVHPVMEGEAGYEDIPGEPWTLAGGYLDDWDVRKSLYWSLFAGAHGYTYGCNPVWQMWRPGRQPLINARRPWREALNLPGAGQMRYARALLLSRPYLERIPDQSLILSDVGASAYHIQATRDGAGRYALIYISTGNAAPIDVPSGDAVHPDPAQLIARLSSGRTMEVDLTRLSGDRLRAYWYDPRTGVAQDIGEFEKQDRKSFTPPEGGPDWILVLDDVACNFPRPGCSFDVHETSTG